MDSPTVYLGKKGYSILKKNISEEECAQIRKDLTVKPFAPPNSIQQPKPFSIYRESPKKLYVPRFYGIERYGYPTRSELSSGEDIDITFAGSLRDYQKNIIDAYLCETKKTGCGLLEVPCGRGKCLGYDTPVALFNGSTKMVQDITHRDVLLGDDHMSRIPFGFVTGMEMMYYVHQDCGMMYRVNESHILTLFHEPSCTMIDIELRDYLKLDKTEKTYYKGIRKTSRRHYILSTIKIVPDKIDHYYGFQVNKNHRFLLGDYTVTHNTVMALNIISQLQKKTLVIVHKEFLMNQWIERIEQFLPDARVGRIQGPTIDIENKDIVIGMLQSLSMKDYDANVFDGFGLTIADECFPFYTPIHTQDGLKYIGSLYEMWKNKMIIPNILSYNTITKDYEFKKMTFSWKKECYELVKIVCSKKILKCTNNHKILTEYGYIEAGKLNIGDIIYCKYDSRHKDNIIAPKINSDQLQIVLGSHLGDGHIQYTKCDRTRMKIIHCKKQKDYCAWKASMFGINNITYIEKNGYSQTPAFYFSTKIFDVSDMFKLDDKKKIYDSLINRIDERGIAVWVMDDGSLYNGYYNIHSNNYDEEQHYNLVKIFTKFNIYPTIKITSRGYYYLNFNKENSAKLSKLIAPYVHNSMEYKIIKDDTCEKFIWDTDFENIGTLKINSISKIINKPVNRCKKAFVYDIEVEDNHNFIVGTKMPSAYSSYIDGIIVHNCHHISAEVFCRSLFKIVTPYMLGLSATMNRKDGLTKVFKQFLGNVLYKEERDSSDPVQVRYIEYRSNDEEFGETVYNFKGQTHYAIMIRKLCEFNQRSEFILRVLQDMRTEMPDQQVMILAHNKSLLKYLYDAIEHRNIATVGYYVGGMKEKALKETESKEVVIATYAMAEEALDIKSLASLIMATPKTDVTQAVGRILRMKHKKPIVVDIVDQHEIFQRQWIKRRRFYTKCNYEVIHNTSETYDTDYENWEVVYKPGQKARIYKKKLTKKDKGPFQQGKCLITIDTSDVPK